MIWDWIISQPFEAYGAVFTVLCFFVSCVINHHIRSHVENMKKSVNADEESAIQTKINIVPSSRLKRLLDI